jgi:hypothetical protein
MLIPVKQSTYSKADQAEVANGFSHGDSSLRFYVYMRSEGDGGVVMLGRPGANSSN